MRRQYLSAILLPLLAVAAPAAAQTSAGPHRDVTEHLDDLATARGDANEAIGQETSDESPEAKKKARDFLIVPVPHSSPSLGAGLTLVAGLFYNPNKSPEPWITGVGAMYTSNKSWAAGVAHKMALADDKFRVSGFAGYANVNVNFYGIGPNAGDRDLSIELNERGFAGLLQGQMQIAPHFFIGPRFEYLSLRTSIRRDKPLFPDLEIPRSEFKSRLSGLGLIANYDSRDSSLNPRKGVLVAVSAMYNLPAIGSDFTHDKYTLNGNIYGDLGPTTVVAARASLCRVTRGGPFYDLCLYGSSSDLRGYESGRYRNRAYWAAQVELRQRLFGRFGAVAFAGVGESASSIGDFGKGKWLPAAGVGVRYQPSRETPINLRVDYAWGRDSKALYVSVGEAF